MKTSLLAIIAALAVFSACTAPEKGEPTAETAAEPEEAPVIETLKAPTAAADIKWEEWAAVGAADARLDWLAGIAESRGALYLVGTRALKRAAGPGPRAEIVFIKVTPDGLDEVAAYPSYFGERAGAAVTAGPGDRVWFVGGMYTPPPIKLAPEGQLDFAELSTPVGDVYTWAPATKELKLEAFLPVPRGDAAAFFADGELYVVGGRYDPADPADDNNRQIHRYNPRDGLWTKLHDLPVPLARATAAVARGGLYVIGGTQLKPAYVTNAVRRYDLIVYKWQTMSQLPAPRAGAGAFAVGDYIYVVGGCEAEALGSPPRMAQKSYRYDLNEKRWEELPSPLPEGCSLATYDGSYFYLVAPHKTYRGRIVRAKGRR
ncbi:MAG TPA: kelch repeat-containing protein [bacterium]|nr:kelch repeat-containing protein [bacterium]